MTREDVLKEISKVTSAVTRNRIKSVFELCRTVDEFLDLTDDQFLAKYRQTKQGKTAKYDLAAVTYTIVAGLKANVKARIFEERKAEKAAQKAEMWFTRDEIMLTATFMDNYKIRRIELGQIRKLLGALEQDKEQNGTATAI